ncbi:MAG: hypothetical protein K0R34_2813 [Herbinix sp.]|jgi:hypothetical protein|nr:hypothetical protein [Herbinix sp.]
MKNFIFSCLILICVSLIPVYAYAATTYNVSTTTKINISEGGSAKLTLPSKYKDIKWTSSDKDVATISKYGLLKALNGGKVTITAKSGKKKFTCTVSIEEDYSEWVLYSTDNLELLAENIVNGYVVYMNDEYYCSPEYVEMIENSEVVYENDIAGDGDNVPTGGGTLTPDMEIEFEDDPELEDDEALKSRIKDLLENNKAISGDEAQ